MFDIHLERPEDRPAVEFLLDLAFGPERCDKTAYRLREGRRPLAELCLLARLDGALAGTIRFWPLQVAESSAQLLLLGPLAVMPGCKGRGLGGTLVGQGLERARRHGHDAVLLVGDPAYYQRFGFHRAVGFSLPGPVEASRLLALELKPEALRGIAGTITQPRRWLRAA